MRTLKKYVFFLGLIILTISFIKCNQKSPFSPEEPPEDPSNNMKFATNVKISYERIEPFKISGSDGVNLMVKLEPEKEEWNDIHKEIMAKISDEKFDYIAEKIPYEEKVWVVVNDQARKNAGGPEWNGRKLYVLGQELTEGFIRKDPWGNNWDVAGFIIKSNNTVVPW